MILKPDLPIERVTCRGLYLDPCRYSEFECFLGLR